MNTFCGPTTADTVQNLSSSPHGFYFMMKRGQGEPSWGCQAGPQFKRTPHVLWDPYGRAPPQAESLSSPTLHKGPPAIYTTWKSPFFPGNLFPLTSPCLSMSRPQPVPFNTCLVAPRPATCLFFVLGFLGIPVGRFMNQLPKVKPDLCTIWNNCYDKTKCESRK